MKRLLISILSMLMILSLIACFKNETKISFVIPKGHSDGYIYADEEISTNSNKIIIQADTGFADGAVSLKPVDLKGESEIQESYITHGVDVKFEASKERWYKLGINVTNDRDSDIIVVMTLKDCKLRIE